MCIPKWMSDSIECGNNKLLKTKLPKNEKHQTRVLLLLELVSDAYLTANRTRYIWSSMQETTPLDHASLTTTGSQAAGNDSRLEIQLLLGSRGLVVLSPAWKTTCSKFNSQ